MPKKPISDRVGVYTAGRLTVLSLGATEAASAAKGIYGLQSSGGMKVAFVPKDYANSEGSAGELARRWNSWEPDGEISKLLSWAKTIEKHLAQERDFAIEMRNLTKETLKITQTFDVVTALGRKTSQGERIVKQTTKE